MPNVTDPQARPSPWLLTPVPAGDFHFVSVEAAPSKARQVATRRQARSHAVKQALENKRKLQQEAGDNFRIATSRDVAPRKKPLKRQKTQVENRLVPICPDLSASALDPFQTLAVNSARLQALLSTREPLRPSLIGTERRRAGS